MRPALKACSLLTGLAEGQAECRQLWPVPASLPAGLTLQARRVQCSLCSVWRIVAFEAVAELREGADWTCSMQR